MKLRVYENVFVNSNVRPGLCFPDKQSDFSDFNLTDFSEMIIGFNGLQLDRLLIYECKRRVGYMCVLRVIYN